MGYALLLWFGGLLGMGERKGWSAILQVEEILVQISYVYVCVYVCMYGSFVVDVKKRSGNLWV